VAQLLAVCRVDGGPAGFDGLRPTADLAERGTGRLARASGGGQASAASLMQQSEPRLARRAGAGELSHVRGSRRVHRRRGPDRCILNEHSSFGVLAGHQLCVAHLLCDRYDPSTGHLLGCLSVDSSIGNAPGGFSVSHATSCVVPAAR
jgi:hypothetical protein